MPIELSNLVQEEGVVEQMSESEDECQNGDMFETTEPPSPVAQEESTETHEATNGIQSSVKKKKKKKAKKPAKEKSTGTNIQKEDTNGRDIRPPLLCISRNKHWKYISSYHGPWLQLPLELLESLLLLNIDPATFAVNDTRSSPISPQSSNQPINRLWEKSASSHLSYSSPPDSPQSMYGQLTIPPPIPPPLPGKAAPPPIDPGVFRSVAAIRKLIDEAAELAVRASSGLSAAALGSMRAGSNMNLSGSPWSAVQTLGINPMGDFGGGRNITMSATRIHRLRVLAVQKLAEAYRMDEIASSVMVMQGGSVFDDIAERVLKLDPNNADARYVHFFHEKIPSRQLAESTTTHILDRLIAEDPQRLEYYRTRGIVHCFRDEFSLAVKDFTYALKESRAIRKAKAVHNAARSNIETRPKGKRKKVKVNGQAPPNGTSPVIEGPDGEQLLVHPSVLPEAPPPLEPQLLFHRGTAYLSHAIHLIEEQIYRIEGLERAPYLDASDVRLSYIENGLFGGTEIGNPDGPLGRSSAPKALAYRLALSQSSFREQVCSLIKRSKRDHERFLAHFDTLEANLETDFDPNLLQRMERSFFILDAFRPNSRSGNPPPAIPDVQLSFTTYHPLMVESHFSILICLLLLGDFHTLVNTFERTANVVAGLEGYPIFLPPRSMSQAEFLETLNRLANGWKYCKIPDAIVRVSNLPIQPTFSERPKVTVNTSLQSIRNDVIDDDITVYSSAGPSTSTGSKTPSQSGRASPDDSDLAKEHDADDDLVESLHCVRALLAPILAKQQKSKAEKKELVKQGGGEKKKPTPINIPLHGPRVEIIIAWMGAVHLPDLESVA